MCFSINISNLLTLSAVLMCSGKLFLNLAVWYVREFRQWVVVLHFGCMMIVPWLSRHCTTYISRIEQFDINIKTLKHLYITDNGGN